MQVIVDGLLTHYARAGHGKTVLVLPGWADTSKSWGAMQQELAEDYDVVVLDLPGFGGSQAPAGAWGLDDYASFAAAFAAKLDIGRLFCVIGHSNGGALALRATASGHLAPERLVLLASAGIRDQQRGRKRALKLLTKTGKIITFPLPAKLKAGLRSRLYAAAGSDLLVAEHMQAIFKQVVGDDVQADARKIDIPALLVYGDADTDTPLVYGQTFHQLLHNSTLETIAGAGHFLHLENPAAVAMNIRGFLR